MKAYQLKIMIKNSKPPIWRRCIVPAGITFSQLSILINEIMGWSGYHLFSFEFNYLDLTIEEEPDTYFADQDMEEASETIIDEYLDGEKWFTYIYDFGDYWTHRVEIEKIIEDYPENYPKVLKYKGDCPLEDSGGIDGYYHVLQVLDNPNHIEYNDIKNWANTVGPGEYDLEDINESLERDYYIKFGIMDTRFQADIYEAMLDGEEGLIACKYKKDKSKKNSGSEKNLKEKKTLNFNNIDIMDLDIDDIDQFTKFLNEKFLNDLANSSIYSNSPEKHDFKSLEDLYLCYTKKELLEIAKIHGLSKRTTYNKDELAAVLSKFVLDKKVMEKYFILADDDEIKAFESVKNKGGFADYYSDENHDFSLDGGYIGIAEDEWLIKTKDVIEAYKKINTKEYHKKRKKVSKIWEYLETACELYGIAPLYIVVKNIRMNEDIKITIDDVRDVLDKYLTRESGFVFNGKELVLKFYSKPQDYKNLIKIQGNKPYYLPDKEEVHMYSKYKLAPLNEHISNLMDFFATKMKVPEYKAINIVEHIQFGIRNNYTMQDIFHLLSEFEVVFDDNQINQVLPLISELWNNTRMIANRGYTPNELKKLEDTNK